MGEKHCHNCKHLDYYTSESYESSDESGYICNKREYKNSKEENKHISDLDHDRYRFKSKKCFEPKTVKIDLIKWVEMPECLRRS